MRGIACWVGRDLEWGPPSYMKSWEASLRMYVSRSHAGIDTDSQMSHRLKLNAVHFANSLEDEKSLLDTSTEVLESKLNFSHQRNLADRCQRI
jgi:hypothetical protein